MWIGQLGGIALIMIVMFGINNDVWNFIIYSAILAIAAVASFFMNDLDKYKLKQ